MSFDWQCLAFAQVPPRLLYGVLALRGRVFVVEQECIYPDADGEDLGAHLVVGSLPDPAAADPAAADPAAADPAAVDPAAADGGIVAGVVATARILPPGTRFAEPSIGRVCTAPAYRRRGLGRALMDFAIRSARQHHPGQPVRISAQAYLQDFYASLGFAAVSGRYLEDGIEHLEMLLPRALNPGRPCADGAGHR